MLYSRCKYSALFGAHTLRTTYVRNMYMGNRKGMTNRLLV